MRAAIFPGQGSQEVGMGKALADTFAEAKEVFAEVDDALSQNLSGLMFEGPIEELTLTQHTQPALMATSMAVVRVLEKQSGKSLAEIVDYVAGHSLGEYTALCAAGSFSLADAARLLRTRGEAMQAAVPAGEGAMAAIIGPDIAAVETIAKQAAGDEVCEVANDNADGQVVISGTAGAIDRAEAIAADNGAKRYVKLNVSAPFHSSLIMSAADVMRDALAAVDVQAPSVPLIANVTTEATTDPDAIRAQLVSQVTGRVRWRESVLNMHKKGVETTLELGSGKVLSGLNRRIVRDIKSLAAHTPEDIEKLIEELA